MHSGVTPENLKRAVAGFVTDTLGLATTRIEQLSAFATNSVFEVHAGGRQLVVKASEAHEALRAETWACTRAAAAGCAAPHVLARGRLRGGYEVGAFIMPRVAALPAGPAHPALVEVGARLRRLHEAKLAGFGWLAEAEWSVEGDPSLTHATWLDFLYDLCDKARHIPKNNEAARGNDAGANDPTTGSVAAERALEVAAAAERAINAHARALAAVDAGVFCHGDLKLSHILVDGDTLAAIIDWGDAIVADPLWEIARFAHRTDTGSLARLLEGYDFGPEMADDLAWRLPLYGALWELEDAVVDSRLGRVGGDHLARIIGALRGLTG